MLETTVLSLLTSSLGLLTITARSWLSWQQNYLMRDEEEEVLTQYESKANAPPESSPHYSNPESHKEHHQLGWEFKILRASRSVFRNPNILQRVCEEESKAGWILLEKLDERRLRFRRPVALRDHIKPETLKYDPYRSHYGSTFDLTTWLGMIALFAAIILPAYLGYMLVSVALTKAREGAPSVVPAPGLPSSPVFSPPE